VCVLKNYKSKKASVTLPLLLTFIIVAFIVLVVRNLTPAQGAVETININGHDVQIEYGPVKPSSFAITTIAADKDYPFYNEIDKYFDFHYIVPVDILDQYKAIFKKEGVAFTYSDGSKNFTIIFNDEKAKTLRFLRKKLK
jgi:hypothetical protein